MNPTDAALWDIERDPTLRTPIVAVMRLSHAPPFEEVRARIALAVQAVPRLRQVVVEPIAGVGVPQWELLDEVDLRYHLRHVVAPDDADWEAVLDFATPAASSDFDRKRPLWELTLVEGLRDGTAAVVMKVHHSLTDGVGGVALLDAMLDATPDAPPLARYDAAGAEAPADASTGAHRSPVGFAGGMLGRLAGVNADLVSLAVRSVQHPERTARETLRMARSVRRMLAPARAPLSPWWTERSMDRELVSVEVSLGEMREAAHRVGCTVNDVFVAGALGGLATLHRQAGHELRHVRVNMPVNLRHEGDVEGGNQWAPARFVLDASIADHVDRMAHVHSVVGSWRHEPALGINHLLAGAIQQLPGGLSARFVSQMMRGIDVAMTDVPGLRERRWLAGAEVTRLYAFAPTGGAAMNLALVSHLDRACLGIVVDRKAVPDGAAAARAIEDGLQATIAAAMVADPAARPPVAANMASATAATATGAAASSRPPERLSTLDTSFLRAETPTTPMHIGALLRLEADGLVDADGALRIDDIRRHIEARLERVPRFRCRLLEVPGHQGRPVWADDPEFDIRRHVIEYGIGGTGSEQDLQELASRLQMELLDHDKPLWELWFVTGLADGTIALVEKVHHALIDGISGVELAAAIFDLEPHPVPDRPVPHHAPPLPSATELLAGALAEQVRDPVATLTGLARMVGRPDDASRLLRGLTTAVSDLAGGNRAPVSSLNRPIGRQRRLLAVTLDRGEVEGVRGALGGTLNDVVLTLVSGGMGALERRRAEGRNRLHAMVPVSTRRRGSNDEPGNRVGAVIVELPTDEPAATARLAAISRTMREHKESGEAAGVASIIGALDHLPGQFAAAARLIHRQPYVNLVITNVPGPRAPLHLLGSRIISMVPVVPLGRNLDVSVAVLTYHDQVVIAFHADPDRCPDLDVAGQEVHDALAELQDAAARSQPPSPDDDTAGRTATGRPRGRGRARARGSAAEPARSSP
jgi:WS/DGAT/MGAT family acyltransferase